MTDKIKRFSYFAIIVLFAVITAKADTLVLKSGKKYNGTISRSSSGKIAIRTRQAKMEFNESKVSFKLTKITPPKNAENAFNLIKQKKFAQAEPIFNQWLKKYNDLPIVWFERALYGVGICLASQGKTKEAAPILQKLLDEFPKTRYRNEAEYWLIELQLSGAPGPELEKKLKGLVKDSNTSDRIRAKAHQGLAKYYESVKKPEKALEEYVSIIVLHGDVDELQEDTQVKCAGLFLQAGRTNEAVFYYKQIIEAYPNTTSAKSAEKKLLSINNVKGD